MNLIQKTGLALFCIALLIFTLLPAFTSYELNEKSIQHLKPAHKEAVQQSLKAEGSIRQSFGSTFSYASAFKSALKSAQKDLEQKAKSGIPKGLDEWDYKLGDWEFKNYLNGALQSSSRGPLKNKPMLFLLLTFGLATLGGLLYILPKFRETEGIKNDGIYHSSMTRGLRLNVRSIMLVLTLGGTIAYGFFYMNKNLFWPLITVAIALLIIALVFFSERKTPGKPARSASPNFTAWLGLFTGFYLIVFYILLYWYPEHMNPWIQMVDPVSRMLNGKGASQWFLYGFLYTVVVLVMGVRMIAKYRHNNYQILRTFSVMFFQTGFAFLLPEILVRLNQPWFDFKNIWPLNYTFFFDWNIKQLIESGGLGIFMLVWGIVLTVIGVPVITYFFGKRWYCSWVCGCGGLAETLGDPYRQLSDKSLRAWKYERYIIHGVLVFAVGMTAMVLYTYFTGSTQVLLFNSEVVRSWYGFLIGAAFAGIVGTGFYPLMGNRTWCRFGCPLAAYLGLVQRFKSRFRITTNGGQCISCGNCSTYCEMGIDVRAYAQKGQNIVRSSCVGCGICAAVCPRGVLKLENGPDKERTVIHISRDEVKILS